MILALDFITPAHSLENALERSRPLSFSLQRVDRHEMVGLYSSQVPLLLTARNGWDAPKQPSLVVLSFWVFWDHEKG